MREKDPSNKSGNKNMADFFQANMAEVRIYYN